MRRGGDAQPSTTILCTLTLLSSLPRDSGRSEFPAIKELTFYVAVVQKPYGLLSILILVM